MDDFLLFGESRDQLREMGKQARERLASLELQIHPDKYRLVRTRDGVDFVGFRVFADGGIRLREKSLKTSAAATAGCLLVCEAAARS